MTTYENFVQNNRNVLLGIFGQIRTSKTLEEAINTNLCSEELDKEACLEAVIILKYNKGEVDFPIVFPKHVTKYDILDSEDLYAFVLCERADAFRRHFVRLFIQFS